MFERETRREKILEARNREIKLKEKEKAGAAHDAHDVSWPILAFIFRQADFIRSAFLQSKDKDKKDDTNVDGGLKEVDPIEKAEKDFFKIIEEEKSKRLKKPNVSFRTSDQNCELWSSIFNRFFLQF